VNKDLPVPVPAPAPAPAPASRLLRLRRWLLPDELQLGWMPVFFLGYLAFLFLPLLFGGQDAAGAGLAPGFDPLWPTVASVVVFLPLYFAAYRTTGLRATACMLGVAALCYLLLPLNPFANTYVIYAAGFAATLARSLWQRLSWLLAMLAAFMAEIHVLGFPMFVVALTLIIAVAVFFSNHYFIENTHKRAELKLSHDEVRRLAALAERERIGRDLHDLLGHTLSMIALKSELAGKLLARDPDAARREIDEVAHVARDALGQVRHAVSGIRAAGLAAELASAKLLLESDGVAFSYRIAALPLPAAIETALALAVRESVTNIQRHAHALHARVALDAEAGEAVLRISDDGRGGAIVPGNGLHGMRERIAALGGRLRVDAQATQGTCVEVRMPLAPGIGHDAAAHR
jgi:two-component system sensor histidine kinase DesK